MGGADFINVLFTEFLEYDPENPNWELRGRFFLDPGHMSPMLYSVLHLSGKFTTEEIRIFRQWEVPRPDIRKKMWNEASKTLPAQDKDTLLRLERQLPPNS